MATLPTYAHPDRLRPHVSVAIATIHALACAAPFCYSGLGLALLVGMATATFLMGITLGFHRLLAHRSFRAWPPVETLMVLLGTLTLQGGPILWVALHRLHHKEPDREQDPHTPLAGFYWAHVHWISYKHPTLMNRAACYRFVPDLDRRRVVRWHEANYYQINIASGLALFGIGWVAGGPGLGLSALVWGGFLRIVLVWHVTFLVNSATHLWGYRNYATHDNSRNCWWVALVTFGEGWHNNHHADPNSAAFGHRWFELDPGYWTLRIMQGLGLVSRITARILPGERMSGRDCGPGSTTIVKDAATPIDAPCPREQLGRDGVVEQHPTHQA